MEGEWLHYRSGHYNGLKMVIQSLGRNNGHFMVVVSLMENGYVTEVASLIEGEWSCYRGGHYCRKNGHVTEVVTNGGRMVMLQMWKV